MIGEADYRSITSSVRTPRLAVLVDEENPHWQMVVTSLIRIFSETWGGKYFLIVPTDGKRIKDKFWELLEAYSPDYLGSYLFTLADLQEADPAKYAATKSRLQKSWTHGQDFDEWFNKQEYHVRVRDFKITADLELQLKNRLAPLHISEHVVRHRLVRDQGLGFPFTKIIDINPHAHRRVVEVVLSKPISDDNLRTLMLSQAGDLSQSAMEEYRGQGVNFKTLPTEYPDERLAESVLRGSVDMSGLSLQKAFRDETDDTSWMPAEDFVKHMPFQTSMLHLAKYYRVDTHRDWEEPVTLVIGDTIDDFCLYYCLSRLHDGTYWLPHAWLAEAERRRTNNARLYRKGREPKPYTKTARVAGMIARQAYREVGFGDTKKRVHVRSMSLGTDELKRSVDIMDRAAWTLTAEFKNRSEIPEPSSTSTDCIARVMEENNYFTPQDMVFIRGKSVGRLQTPKPKNFSHIDPATHKWLTSVDISDYAAPVLPSLGRQIADTYESRVAADGVAFLCPGIATFSADIDANLTRPSLAIVEAEQILKQYFAESGLEINPSDKGNYLTDTISRFGGLEAATDFLAAPRTRAILDLFQVKKSTQGGEVVYLEEERRAFVSYLGVKDCVEEDAVRMIDELVGKDILQRGLIFRCLRCRLSSWYSLASLSARFVCRRCGFDQQFAKQNWKLPDEPRWYYALAETVNQWYTHNSDLTIVTLGHLKKGSKRSFQYLPEIDVVNFPAPGEKQEIDVACLLDSKIVIGECKTEALLPKHADKYEALARRLLRRPDQIVFATSQRSVSDAFRSKVDNMRGGTLLLRDDLPA
jgi:hypothetical protein